MGEFEPKTDQTILVQKRPTSRAKLEARIDSIRVHHLSSNLFQQPVLYVTFNSTWVLSLSSKWSFHSTSLIWWSPDNTIVIVHINIE